MLVETGNSFIDYQDQIVKILNGLDESEYWDVLSFLIASCSLSIKMTKFVEFMVVSKVEQQPLQAISIYTDLAIASHQIKYMDKSKDLIDWQMSMAMNNGDYQKILQLLSIVRKYSSN